MPITHLLQPNPKWYFVNVSGLPLGAGYLAVYSSLNQ
jgi:presenilin-like A22 family membrane protease